MYPLLGVWAFSVRSSFARIDCCFVCFGRFDSCFGCFACSACRFACFGCNFGFA